MLMFNMLKSGALKMFCLGEHNKFTFNIWGKNNNQYCAQVKLDNF